MWYPDVIEIQINGPPSYIWMSSKNMSMNIICIVLQFDYESHFSFPLIRIAKAFNAFFWNNQLFPCLYTYNRFWCDISIGFIEWINSWIFRTIFFIQGDDEIDAFKQYRICHHTKYFKTVVLLEKCPDIFVQKLKVIFWRNSNGSHSETVWYFSTLFSYSR